MFKVEKTGLGKMWDYIRAIIIAGLFVAWGFLFLLAKSDFSDSEWRIPVLAFFLVLLLLIPICFYAVLDDATKYLIVERKEFRIKHLFRKEIIVTPDQIKKWQLYTQFLRTGGTSENIIVYYGKRSKIEFAIHECVNFEKLLKHLDAKYAEKKV